MREVYVDESSQNGHAFMVLGAAVIPGAAVGAALSTLGAVLERHQTFGELKWTKVSGAKFGLYQELIDTHFELVRTLGLQFSAMIVDSARIDHQTYNEGDAELGFNKFLFQLLLHRVVLRFGDAEKIVVYLDSRTAARHPEELQSILNQAAARKLGRQWHSPVSKVVFRDSKTSRLIQLVDLMTGAIAWHKNNRDTRPEASQHKSALAQVVAGKIGRARLGGDTREPGFQVWNFQLRAQRRGGAR